MRSLFKGGYHSRYAYTRVIVHIRYNSAKNMASQGKWTKHFVSTSSFYKMVWTPFWGEILTATPEPKNNHNMRCVCEEGWRNRLPCTAHQKFSSLQHSFPVVCTVSSHLELSSLHPWQLLWMLLNVAYILFHSLSSASSVQVNTVCTYQLG